MISKKPEQDSSIVKKAHIITRLLPEAKNVDNASIKAGIEKRNQ